MAASYPGAVKNFLVLEDGVDTVIAAHPNDRAAEITAIETELGTDPAGSAADLKTRLAVSLNNDGTIKAGVAWKHSGTSVYNAAAPTSWTDLNLSAVVGANRALVFLRIKPATTIDVKFRTNGDDTEEIGSGGVDRNGTVEGYIATNYVSYFMVETDAAGVIEWIANAVSVQIWVQGYIK